MVENQTLKEELTETLQNNEMVQQMLAGMISDFQKKAGESIEKTASEQGVAPTDIMFVARGGNKHFYLLLNASFRGYAMKFNCAETDVQFALNFKESAPGTKQFNLYPQIYHDYEPKLDFRFMEEKEQADLEHYILAILPEVIAPFRERMKTNNHDYGDVSFVFYKLPKDDIIRLGIFLPDADGDLEKVTTILPENFNITGHRFIYFEIWKQSKCLRPASFAVDVLGMNFPVEETTETALRFTLGGNFELKIPNLPVIPARKGRIAEIAEKTNVAANNVMVAIFKEPNAEKSGELKTAIDVFVIDEIGNAVRQNVSDILFGGEPEQRPEVKLTA